MAGLETEAVVERFREVVGSSEGVLYRAAQRNRAHEMKDLADRLIENKRAIEALERRAAEKAGMKFLFFDETKLFGKEQDRYIKEYVDTLLGDIAREILEAVKLGKEIHGKIEERTP